MMPNSEARKRAAANEPSADGDVVGRLADIVHRAIEPVGAEGAPKCPESDEGFVGCFAAAHSILASDWLAAHTAAAERRGAERALIEAADWLAANDNARPEYDEVQAAFEDPELWLRVRAEEIGTS